MRRCPRAGLAATLVLAASVAAGCGGIDVPRAAQLELFVMDDTITVIEPTGPLRLEGEAVLTIANFSDGPRQLVLARTDLPVTDLPDELLDVISPRDDDRVVAVTGELAVPRITINRGVPTPTPSRARLHVHLEPGERYVLFDRLGGLRHGLTLVLEPVRP